MTIALSFIAGKGEYAKQETKHETRTSQASFFNKPAELPLKKLKEEIIESIDTYLHSNKWFCNKALTEVKHQDAQKLKNTMLTEK